eukprot:6176869-Pleurochrysis_carterae.AAC.1
MRSSGQLALVAAAATRRTLPCVVSRRACIGTQCAGPESRLNGMPGCVLRGTRVLLRRTWTSTT